MKKIWLCAAIVAAVLAMASQAKAEAPAAAEAAKPAVESKQAEPPPKLAEGAPCDETCECTDGLVCRKDTKLCPVVKTCQKPLAKKKVVKAPAKKVVIVVLKDQVPDECRALFEKAYAFYSTHPATQHDLELARQYFHEALDKCPGNAALEFDTGVVETRLYWMTCFEQYRTEALQHFASFRRLNIKPAEMNDPLVWERRLDEAQVKCYPAPVNLAPPPIYQPAVPPYVAPPTPPAPATPPGPYDFKPQGVIGGFIPLSAFFVNRDNGEAAIDIGLGAVLGFNLNAPRMDITLIAGGGLARHTNRTDGAGLATGQLSLTWKPAENAKWFGVGLYGNLAVEAQGNGIRNWSVGIGPAFKFSFSCDRFAIVAGLGLAVGGTRDGVPPIPGLSDTPPPGGRPALEIPGFNAGVAFVGQLPGVCRTD